MEEETTDFTVIEELNELITTLELEITDTSEQLATERHMLGVFFTKVAFKITKKSHLEQ